MVLDVVVTEELTVLKVVAELTVLEVVAELELKIVAKRELVVLVLVLVVGLVVKEVVVVELGVVVLDEVVLGLTDWLRLKLTVVVLIRLPAFEAKDTGADDDADEMGCTEDTELCVKDGPPVVPWPEVADGDRLDEEPED